MYNPSSTYRIQFHKEFIFKDLDKILPYLKNLGVQTIYASPIFEAVLGSTHGYDVLNPHRINPEIGTEEELISISKKLKKLNMYWLQDIVPNHMTYHPSNKWLMDVLEKWDKSAYFNFFDLNIVNPLKDKRLMVPFLGESIDDAIQNKSLKLIINHGRLFINTASGNWPVNISSYQYLLKNNLLNKHEKFNEVKKMLPKILRVRNVSVFEKESLEFYKQFQLAIKAKLNLARVKKVIEEVNENPALFNQFLKLQYYRLCHWQETEKQINYRRFFTVNSLICLNIQHQNVFETYHSYIFSLVEKGIFQGLRIDHIDGLFDPEKYLSTLRANVGDDIYITVEKILATDEMLPINWPVQGNTGYDFLAMANNLFTNKSAEQYLDKIYEEVIKKPLKVKELIIEKKTAILCEHMQGELNHLYELFISLDLASQTELDLVGENPLKDGISKILIYCSVYRFYGNQSNFAEVQNGLDKIFSLVPKTEKVLPSLNLLAKSLLDDTLKKGDLHQQKVICFYQRCMQYSGPLMAKGVEDTLMYSYNRFIGHTEVGDSPSTFGLSVKEFHQKMIDRQKIFPLSINGTSTHDTKRGEDVRARLNILTDVPKRWQKLVRKFQANKAKYANNLHRNDIYFIYQTLLGVMPYINEANLHDRLFNYIEKALREAKKRSGWAEPNEEYEANAKKFIAKLLDKKQGNYQKLTKFLLSIADFSIVNSLAQLTLKCTTPGIPDIYQGTEFWDLSLVDPDNRRPVDYIIRNECLEEIQQANLSQLWKERFNGKIKLWLTQLLLQQRKQLKNLFDKGEYIPLKIKGSYKKHIIAYLRKHQGDYLIVVLPLGLAEICDKNIKGFNWENTKVIIPDNAPLYWKNILDGNKQKIKQGQIVIKNLFKDFMISVLISSK